MGSAQIIILYIAIIILIIALILIGLALSYTKDQQKWPPITPQCPDYWLIDGSGNNAKCVNIKNLGTCKPNPGDKYLKMDFNSSAFMGSNEMCAKYTWAKNCGVSWDGITYGVNNPCQKA